MNVIPLLKYGYKYKKGINQLIFQSELWIFQWQGIARSNLFIEFVYRETNQSRTWEQTRRTTGLELQLNLMMGFTKWRVERDLERVHIAKVRSELRTKLTERKLKYFGLKLAWAQQLYGIQPKCKGRTTFYCNSKCNIVQHLIAATRFLSNSLGLSCRLPLVNAGHYVPVQI